MKYLLDTSIFLWSLVADDRLSVKAKEILEPRANDLYFSAASSWEIAIKFVRGSLPLPKKPSVYIPLILNSLAVHPLHITHEHALLAGELPLHHCDPFDRMLVAQARSEGMILLTGDRIFEKYKVEQVYCRK